MGCLFGFLSLFFLPFKWAFIITIHIFKWIGYGFLALIGLILHLLGINFPTSSTYQFEDVENELIKIDLLDGIEFEHYIANLLRELGYSNITVSQASGDYGVDIVATKDMISHAFQCKRYNSKVSNDAVQEVVAGLSPYNCSKGIVVTNNYFTKNAIELANSNNIELWDRDKLAELIGRVLKSKAEPGKTRHSEDVFNYKSSNLDNNPDILLHKAINLIANEGHASISLLQRRLNIGYAEASRLIDEIEAMGLIGGFQGSEPRKVLITKDDLEF